MMPFVASLRDAAQQMVGYTAPLVVTTLVLIPVGDLAGTTASPRWSSASVPRPVALRRNRRPGGEPAVFTFSITYVTLLFKAMTLDLCSA